MNGYEQIEKQLEAYRQALPEAQEEWPLQVRKAYKCIIENLFDSRLKVGWIKEQCFISSHNFSVRFAHFIGQKPKNIYKPSSYERGRKRADKPTISRNNDLRNCCSSRCIICFHIHQKL